MIRLATIKDYPGIRNVWENCFTTDTEYLDLFFNHCNSKVSIVYEIDGKIVSSLHTLPISYISSSHNAGYKTCFPGLYLYGVGTLPEYRGNGYSSSLLSHLENKSQKLGWDFIITHPAEPTLIDFYKKNGYCLPIFEKEKLPFCEKKSNILDYSGIDLFRIRKKLLKSNYFEWSHIMLSYIIQEAKLNPEEPTAHISEIKKYPHALINPLSVFFSIDQNKAIFSFTME